MSKFLACFISLNCIRFTWSNVIVILLFMVAFDIVNTLDILGQLDECSVAFVSK